MGIKASAQYTIAEIHEECNVVISNESHVFRADKDNTAVAGNTSIQIYGYQGSTQIATTIGTISGLPSAGMTATINNNGKTNTSITVAVTTALTSSVANNGVLTIPITVAGKTFNKTFSWSKAQTGATGATGGTGAAARTYWVTSSANTVTRSMKGTLTPATITFGAYYRDGTSAKSTAYSGRFIIQESTDGATWTTKYTSSANESSKVYTPTATTNLVKCTMYAAGGTTNALDTLTIGIVDSIDDLQIGGRNLLLNSDTLPYETLPEEGFYTIEKTIVDDNDAKSGKHIEYKFISDRTYCRGFAIQMLDKIYNKTGKTFTWSFEAKCSAERKLYTVGQLFMSNATTTISLNTEWQKYTFTWTVNDSNQQPYFAFFTTHYYDGGFSYYETLEPNDIIYIRDFKIEEGTVATTWTPAPEDTKPIDIKVGGRNLLLNSSFTENDDKWNNGGTAPEFVEYDGKKCAHFQHDSIETVNGVIQQLNEKLDRNTEYTISGYIQIMDDVFQEGNDPDIYFLIRNQFGSTAMLKIPNLSNWQHVSFTFTTPDNERITENETLIFASSKMFGDLYFCNFKLEKGNTSTDWTPAPEDASDKINSIEKSVSEVIVGTQTTATNAWTGVASFSTLTDGQQISYWLPYAGTSSSATLDLTLAGGTATGAKNLYYGGTTRITTHYPAGSVIHLTYRENVSIAGSTTLYTGWWADANYNTDTYDRIKYNSAITALAAISSGRIVTGTASGFKHIAASTAFDINKPILLAGSAIAANATGTNNYIAYSNINLASTKSGFTGTKGKTVYIVGTLNGTTFTPNSTLFTTTEPTTADGLVYIALGLMSSTTNSTLYPEHPLYKYVNGKFQSLSQVAYEAQENLDNLSIGGRNFILNTKTAITFSDATTDKLVLSDYAKNLIKENDTLTLSFDAKASTSLFIDFYWRSNDTSYASTSFLPGTALTTEYQHFTFTSAAGLDLLTSKILYLRVRQNTALHGSATAVGTVEIKNVKLEKGTQASDWTPAPEDIEQDINDRPSREEVANNISNNIDAVNTTTDQKIAASIKDTDAKIEDAKGGFATQVDGVRKEVDAAGNVIRELENYATKFLITSNGMQMNIEKEKGANLIKNSVMIQHRDSSSGVQANYWDGFNTSLAITNAQIPNLASTNDGTSRANTDSGNYFSLDFTKNTSSMKYACLISNPVDFKLNASNILLSYKIRERSAINGKVFVGLIFYKNTDSSDKEISSKLCADLGTISTSAGFANARYVPVTEYSTGTMGNVFTEKVMYKTLPISRTQTAVVEESLPIQVVRDANDSSVILEKYVTLSYTPDSSNSTVTLVNYNGTTTGVTPTGTKVPLELSVNNDYVAVRYTRKLSNYVSMSSPTSAKIVTDLGKQNATDIKIYYDSSTKKIWVFNPFTGTYIASNNLYSDTVADTDINTVRVVIGAYGSAVLTGIVDFSDLKLEYDTISTLWSSHQNEIYGKEYKMDEYGFSITTDTNQMFIDEDEIAAYEIDSSGNLKTDDPVFQIKKENTILRRTVIHNELLIENETTTEDDAFIMKQQKVGSKWFYIFY